MPDHRDDILAIVSGADYRPVKPKGIAKKLGLAGDGLSPDYAAWCGNVGEQSPINISTADAEYVKKLPKLKFRYFGVTTRDGEFSITMTAQRGGYSEKQVTAIAGVVEDLLATPRHWPAPSDTKPATARSVAITRVS